MRTNTQNTFFKHTETHAEKIQMSKRHVDHLHLPAWLLISVEIELLINQEADPNHVHDRHTLPNTHKDTNTESVHVSCLSRLDAEENGNALWGPNDVLPKMALRCHLKWMAAQKQEVFSWKQSSIYDVRTSSPPSWWKCSLSNHVRASSAHLCFVA